MVVGTQSPSPWPERLHWWIDSVGGFLVLTKPIIVVGQRGRPGNDLEVFGNISGHHADLRRTPTGYMLLAHAETSVNDKPGTTFLLKHKDQIKFRNVLARFDQPIKHSTTARLTFDLSQRLQYSLDGVLLLGNNCLLCDSPDAHIRTRWPEKLFISQQPDGYCVRFPGDFYVDGTKVNGFAKLSPTSEVRGTWGAMRFEPISAKIDAGLANTTEMSHEAPKEDRQDA